MDESFRIFLRGLGATALFTSAFPGVFPLTVRLALIVSFPILFSGPFFTDARFLALFQSEGLTLLIPELLIGILIAAPACAACWMSLLAGSWLAALVLPESTLWFRGRGFERESPDGSEYCRFRNVLLSLCLLGGVAFLPYLPELFARIAESLKTFPSPTDPGFFDSALTRRVFLPAIQLSWVAALGFALPVLAVSLAFDAGAALIGRYVRPLRDDPSLWSLRALLLGAALGASVYSLTDMADQIARENLNQKKVQRLVEISSAPVD